MNHREARRLIGKTIRDVVLIDVDKNNGGSGTATTPCIQFDDGSWMRIMTAETDLGGEYGHTLIYPAKPPVGDRAKGGGNQ